MIQKAVLTNCFQYKAEEKQNPYIGFTSFQHFRNECLYSDIIVKPENNMTETENVECYPVPKYVPQKGREEGGYPDTAIAYIRILWKEFEPRKEEYQYQFIEDILSKARACDQTIMFRLMAHSTRENDDVPDWLKEIILCPERPIGERVKDSPRDPLFFEYYAKAVRKIGEHFDKDPTFDMVDITMPGAWGEGYKLDEYSDEELIKWMDLYVDTFKNTRLLGQIGNPRFIHYANEKGAVVGWRADGAGEQYRMHERYPGLIKLMPDVWKYAPISFESYWWLGEWQRQGWDIEEIIKHTLEWHISSFNGKSLPIPNEWEDKIQYWNSKMGYHFAIDYFKYPEKACASEELIFELGIENVGVAPIYNEIPLKIRLINDVTDYTFVTEVDIRKWLPGKHVNTINIILPENIPVGKYQVEMGLVKEDTPMIYLCTDAARNGRYYQIAELEIIL